MIRPVGRMFLGALGASAAGLAVLFAVFAWLLSTGPISLAFLSPYVEDVLAKADSEFRIEFDDVVLAWAGWERNLDVRAIGVRVRRSDNTLLASLPAVSVALSGRALIRGAVAPTSLELIGVDARMVRSADGAIDFGLESDAAETGDLAEQLLDELLRPPDPTRMMGYLRRVSVLDGKLTVFDRISGVSWRAPRADVVLLRDRSGIEGVAQVDVALGDELVSLKANAIYNSGGRSARVTLSVSDLEPTRLREAGIPIPHLAALKMPVGGTVQFTVDAAGRFSDVDLELAAGPGHVDLPEFYAAPLEVRALELKGALADGFGSLQVDSFSADLGGPTAALKGQVWLAEGARGARLDGVLDELSIAELKRLWPGSVAPGAYAWVESHLNEGQITGVEFRVDMPPAAVADDRQLRNPFALEFGFHGLSILYHLELPPIVHGKGTARLGPRGFELVLSDGRISELAVSDGSLVITGLDEDHKRARIGAVVKGSIQETLTVLDHEPLGFARQLNLDPARLGGLAGTRLQLSFPVKKDLRGSEIRYSAAANLSNAMIPDFSPGYSLSHGTLSLQVDGHGISLSGLAALNGVPVELAWQRRFGAGQAFGSRFTLSGVFDDAERAALLVPGGQFLSGPVAIDLEIVSGKDQGFRASAEVDLARAGLSLPMLHWRKPPEAAGSLRFTLQGDLGGALRVDSFSLTAADLEASGEVLFGSGWSLNNVRLSRLVYGGPTGTDVSASFRASDDQGLTLALEGQRFDLRPFLDEFGSGRGADNSPPLALSARLGEVIVSDERALSDVTASATRQDGRWSRLEMTANLNGGAPLQVSLSPGEGGRRIRVLSGDAASVARALDIFLNGEGGTLEARAVIRDDLPGRPIQGQVVVDRFRVRRAPVLASILTVGSLTGMVDLLNGEGVNFARFVAPFTMAEKKLTLEKARAYGPALGVTINGVIDRGARTLDLEGTIVPAYTINSLLGNIPVLGDIFVGRKGEGIFAVTYSVKGPTQEPRVVVNPLAALAPGILRRMLFGSGSDEPPPNLSEREHSR